MLLTHFIKRWCTKLVSLICVCVINIMQVSASTWVLVFGIIFSGWNLIQKMLRLASNILKGLSHCHVFIYRTQVTCCTWHTLIWNVLDRFNSVGPTKPHYAGKYTRGKCAKYNINTKAWYAIADAALTGLLINNTSMKLL